jgi:hypothetical protein
VSRIETEGGRLDFTFEGDKNGLAALHRALVAEVEGVVSFYERRLTVEDVFLASDGGGRAATARKKELSL